MDVIIICDGTAPSKSQILKLLNKDTTLIATDGGANTAYQLGFEPEYIIGDMDSYSPTGDEKAEVLRIDDQETNDLEKALKLALKKGFDNVIVLGATGKRLDHTLKNLSVLLQFNPEFDSIIFKDHHSDIFLIDSPFRQQYPIGTTISLYPLSGRVDGIKTKGLQYPLNNESLINGVRDGSSNKTIKKEIEITYKRGDLLLFVISDTQI
ncbi:MAG: thiamine diphosphokinase [Balneolaceae bacterium]